MSDVPNLHRHAVTTSPSGLARVVRRSIFALAVVALAALGNAAAAHAQTVDITVEPLTPAPGAPVTVTVTGAPPGDPVVVRLGVEEESTIVDASGNATVMIAAPNQPGDAVGTVNIGIVDFPITVTVQSAIPATTTTTTPTTTTPTTTTTLPPPPPPVTGLEDAGTMVGLGAALLAGGLGLALLARRPAAATVAGGPVTHYQIEHGRQRAHRSSRRR